MNNFLLIDLALLGTDCSVPSLADETRPSWVYPLYDEGAYKVTPLLIELQEVITSGDVSQAMQLWNSREPQLHASIIHSNLSLAQLGAHLQQFTYILTKDGGTLTFRFGDCAVLSCLPEHLTAEQWRTMTMPIYRWVIHGRDGKLRNLVLAKKTAEPSKVPLILEEKQLASLRDALTADRLIYHLRRIRPTQVEHYHGTELHALVTEAYSMWRISEHTDQLLLLDFLIGVIDTAGRILRMTGMAQILAVSSVETVRGELKKAVTRNSFQE